MSNHFPACVQCGMENTYADAGNWVCPDCAHEWPIASATTEPEADGPTVRDANGKPLADGDCVVLIKDLKVKGGATLKMGAKAKNIRLVDGDHPVDVKIDGVGYLLKACYLKKV